MCWKGNSVAGWRDCRAFDMSTEGKMILLAIFAAMAQNAGFDDGIVMRH